MQITDAPLGKSSEYPDRYDPKLLFPVDRRLNREQLGLPETTRWFGEDIWNAYELSWLAPSGVPRVAVGEIRVPFDSPFLIESKSLKLYFNSLNQHTFDSLAALEATIVADLSQAAGAPVWVGVSSVDTTRMVHGHPAHAVLIDDLDVTGVAGNAPEALLSVDNTITVTERLCSHLLKTNCPVTGQPDWASLIVEYRGPKIRREGLLAYLIAFRSHQDFHEHCVERIFRDVMAQCACETLLVSARYTRRGGIDINPWRANYPCEVDNLRLLRQ